MLELNLRHHRFLLAEVRFDGVAKAFDQRRQTGTVGRLAGSDDLVEQLDHGRIVCVDSFDSGRDIRWPTNGFQVVHAPFLKSVEVLVVFTTSIRCAELRDDGAAEQRVLSGDVLKHPLMDEIPEGRNALFEGFERVKSSPDFSEQALVFVPVLLSPFVLAVTHQRFFARKMRDHFRIHVEQRQFEFG